MNTKAVIKKPVVAIIAAVSKDGVYGYRNGLAWVTKGKSEVPEDMEHFVEHTKGNTVIMGMNTYDSLPKKYKPLPDRRNIVISSKKVLIPGVARCETFLNAYLLACSEDAQRIYIIGGKQLINHVLSKHIELVDQFFLTVVRKNYGPVNGVMLGSSEDHGYVMSAEFLELEKRYPFKNIGSKHITSRDSDIPITFSYYEKIRSAT